MFRRVSFLLFVVACVGCNGASQTHSATGEPAAAKPAPALVKPKKQTKQTTAPRSTPSAASAPDAGAPKAEVPVGMAIVEGGTFKMGSDKEGEQDEHPAHDVTLKSFYLDVYEVTNGQYLECVDAKKCRAYREDAAKSMKYKSEKAFRGPKQPVMGVSWDDAKTYCEWKGKRLPTEAEWERAARGSDNRTYPWGNETPDADKHGCFQGCKSGTTADVGSFPADKGPYGHHDLAGSVWEWMADHYDPYAYKRSTASQGVPGSCDEILAAQDELRKTKQQGYTGTNPIPAECERVLRGGAFNYHAKGLRSSNRVHHPGTWRLLVAGFRCAKGGD
jgi:formylglycine-generating enzyme required for sulfatase activity